MLFFSHLRYALKLQKFALYLASNVLEVTVEGKRTQATGLVGEIKNRLDLRERMSKGRQDQALLNRML